MEPLATHRTPRARPLLAAIALALAAWTAVVAITEDGPAAPILLFLTLPALVTAVVLAFERVLTLYPTRLEVRRWLRPAFLPIPLGQRRLIPADRVVSIQRRVHRTTKQPNSPGSPREPTGPWRFAYSETLTLDDGTTVRVRRHKDRDDEAGRFVEQVASTLGARRLETTRSQSVDRTRY